MDAWTEGWTDGRMKQWTDESLRVQTVCYFSLQGDSVILHT